MSGRLLPAAAAFEGMCRRSGQFLKLVDGLCEAMIGSEDAKDLLLLLSDILAIIKEYVRAAGSYRSAPTARIFGLDDVSVSVEEGGEVVRGAKRRRPMPILSYATLLSATERRGAKRRARSRTY